MSVMARRLAACWALLAASPCFGLAITKVKGKTRSGGEPIEEAYQHYIETHEQYHPYSPPGSCDCLNFKEVYDTQQARCGSGYESYTHTLVAGDTMPNDNTWCKGIALYKHMDIAACVRVSKVGNPDRQYSRDHFTSGGWCYVSAACNDLGDNGLAVNDEVSVKICEYHDPWISDLPAAHLYAFAKEKQLDFPLLVQMAWGVMLDVYGERALKKRGELLDLGKTHALDPHAVVLCGKRPHVRNAGFDNCGSKSMYILEKNTFVWCVDCGMCLLDNDGNQTGCLGERALDY